MFVTLKNDPSRIFSCFRYSFPFEWPSSFNEMFIDSMLHPDPASSMYLNKSNLHFRYCADSADSIPWHFNGSDFVIGKQYHPKLQPIEVIVKFGDYVVYDVDSKVFTAVGANMFEKMFSICELKLVAQNDN